MSRLNHIARSTLIVAVFFGLEKGLGFVRSVLVAREFGLSTGLDAYNAANNVPDLLFALISGGALAMAFIPVLSQYLEKDGREAAWDLFSRIANLVFLVTAGLSLLMALLAGPLVRAEFGIAPGFSPEQQALVVDLMRLNLIATLLFSMAGLAIAGLQANQHFFLPALAPSMYDIGALFGVLVLAPEQPYQFGPITLPTLGLGIYGLVYGVIIGAAMFLAIQIPGLIYFKFRWKPVIGLHHPGVMRVLVLMGPRVLTVLLIQLVFLAQDNIASRLMAGSVTALVYGWLFMQVPESLIGTAIGTVMLPTLSEQASRRDAEAFIHSLNSTMRVILALTIPSAVLIGIGIRPVVALLNFNPQGAEMVVWTTRAFLVGLMGHSLLEITARSFYAQQDARTPLKTKGGAVAAYVLLVIVLGLTLGAPGIALANSLAFTGEALFQLWLLNRRFHGIIDVGSTLLRVGIVTLGGALLALALLRLPFPSLPLTVGALGISGLAILPFVWPEVRLLIKL